MSETVTAEKRSCENCGTRRCAESRVAFYWSICIESNFTKGWTPKQPEQPNGFQNTQERKMKQ